MMQYDPVIESAIEQVIEEFFRRHAGLNVEEVGALVPESDLWAQVQPYGIDATICFLAKYFRHDWDRVRAILFHLPEWYEQYDFPQLAAALEWANGDVDIVKTLIFTFSVPLSLDIYSYYRQQNPDLHPQKIQFLDYYFGWRGGGLQYGSISMHYVLRTSLYDQQVFHMLQARFMRHGIRPLLPRAQQPATKPSWKTRVFRCLSDFLTYGYCRKHIEPQPHRDLPLLGAVLDAHDETDMI